MGYRIAVASRDGRTVNEHFGRAAEFAVFQVDDTGEFTFLELRATLPACRGGPGEEDGLARTAELLRDCRAVLVARLGREAEVVLRQRGVEPVEVLNYIPQAIAAYHQSRVPAGGERGEEW